MRYGIDIDYASFHFFTFFPKTLRYRKRILKYKIDEYDHFLCFLAAESNFYNYLSPTSLDLAVQEMKICALLKRLSKSGLSLYSGCL